MVCEGSQHFTILKIPTNCEYLGAIHSINPPQSFVFMHFDSSYILLLKKKFGSKLFGAKAYPIQTRIYNHYSASIATYIFPLAKESMAFTR